MRQIYEADDAGSDGRARREHQFRQVELLLAHAVETVPYYRARAAAFGGDGRKRPLTPERWRSFPLLTRQIIQQYGRSGLMLSERIPPEHGRLMETVTSGSTGVPVVAQQTELTQTVFRATTLRETLWLQCEGPDYLMTFPSNFLAIARHARENGIRLPSVRGLRSVGEAVTPELREICREFWDVEIDDAGEPCPSGKIGRVVLTPLQNFAMPMIRYAIGDYTEFGEPCPCGRGLPVLRRILGRTRNVVTLLSGGKRFSMLPGRTFAHTPAIVQHQVVQTALEEIEVRLVARKPLEPAEENSIRDEIVDQLGHPFRIRFTYCDEIPRSPEGKFEDFRSEL